MRSSDCGSTSPHGESVTPRGDGGRLIIVSNRLPVTVHTDGDTATVRRSSGGLATGMRGPHERSQGMWVGWPGDLSALDDGGRAAVLDQLAALRTIPVHLSDSEVRVFYEDISNAVLWAICHDRIDRLPLRVVGWDIYEAANERFADAVVEQWRPGDTIWVHDYQLLRLPALLRARLPQARIGFFLHIPFPNPEIFFTLPVRRWLVEGMLGADLIGFHTRRYRGHFTAALRRLIGLEMDATDHVVHGGRRIRLGIFPMGVDAADFAHRATSREVSSLTLELKQNSQRLLVGIDRLDYSKGIARRLLSFEQLLIQHPEWRERVRLVQVAVPSRGRVSEYRRFRREVEALVGRVNGEFATPGWTPVQYLFRSVSSPTLLSLYRAADVMLVTPLRDGMNLVAKEFVASRSDEDGVLVLSEFAGAADELRDALLVNPYDVDGVAEAIHAALTMDGLERRSRMRRLRAQVFQWDVHRWAGAFLDTLSAGRPDPA
jgi:trehalose 6-phosphate synthase/phosphatase